MSKSIQILGTGCRKCKKMAQAVQDVVSYHNIDANIEKVEDIKEIMKLNIISMPALVVDDVVEIKGRVPSKDEILNILS